MTLFELVKHFRKEIDSYHLHPAEDIGIKFLKNRKGNGLYGRDHFKTSPMMGESCVGFCFKNMIIKKRYDVNYDIDHTEVVVHDVSTEEWVLEKSFLINKDDFDLEADNAILVLAYDMILTMNVDEILKDLGVEI